MNKFCLFIMGSLLLLCTGVEARCDVYIIDGDTVAHFDGSQLVGKQIAQYTVTQQAGGQHMSVHHITTVSGHGKAAPSPGAAPAAQGEPLLVVDGVVCGGNINDVKPDDIAYVDVYKPDSEVARGYGALGKSGVIKIFTKKSSSGITYIVDGKVVTKADFNKIKLDDIKAIKVLKRGTAQAIKSCPAGKTDDVYLVTTK